MKGRLKPSEGEKSIMAHLVKRLTRKNCGVAGLTYGGYFLYKDTVIVDLLQNTRTRKVFIWVRAYPVWCDCKFDRKYLLKLDQTIDTFSATWAQPVDAVDLERLGADLEKLYQQLKQFEK